MGGHDTIDAEYAEAIGRATYAFAVMEWNAIWCCEALDDGYMDELGHRTAGHVGEEFERLARADGSEALGRGGAAVPPPGEDPQRHGPRQARPHPGRPPHPGARRQAMDAGRHPQTPNACSSSARTGWRTC